MNRKWITAAAAIIVIVLIVSIGRYLSQREEDAKPVNETKKKVAIILKMKEGDYWDTIKVGAEAAAKEFNVTLSVLAPDGEDEVEVQVELIQQALKEGSHALVVAINEDKVLSDLVNQMAGGLPVIAVDTPINGLRAKSFIGIDHYEAGLKAGKKLVELTGKQARIVVMSYGKGNINAQQKEQGLMDEWSKDPHIQVIERAYCTSDPKQCAMQAHRLLSHPSIDGVVALNDAASIGMAKELVRLGLDGHVKLVAFDSAPEELEMLQDGIIHATIIQNPFSMGYLGVKLAVEALQGKSIPARVNTETKVIDFDNMFWSDNQKLLFPFVK